MSPAATMRAIVVDRHGEPGEVMGVRERPRPRPGPGQVRVRTVLSPIHTHDLETVRGEYGHSPQLPFTPGTEAVGVIDALGEGVTQLQLGQRVAAAGVQGAWAEWFVCGAERVVPVPEAVDDEAACQLIAMPLSAVLLFDDLAVPAGGWLAQNTANGAVGRIVNLLARRKGVQVLNLVRSGDAARSLREAGAPHVVDTSEPHWRDAVAAATQGAPVLRAVDSLGGPSAGDLLGLLADGGTLVSFGSMNALTLPLQIEHLLYRQLSVRGFWAAARGAAMPTAERVRRIGELIDLVGSGELALPVSSRHGLADAAAAAAAVGRPGRRGKVALAPAAG